MTTPTKAGRTRVERGIYRQPNGKYAVCARRAGRLHFRTTGRDLGEARRAREELISALEAGRVPASPRLRLDTVAGRWSARFEAMVAAGERHRRTYEAHRFHLDHDILPRLGHRRSAGRCTGRVSTCRRPVGGRSRGRVLGREEVALLLECCPELLGLVWADEPEERRRPPRRSATWQGRWRWARES